YHRGGLAFSLFGTRRELDLATIHLHIGLEPGVKLIPGRGRGHAPTQRDTKSLAKILTTVKHVQN
ncbi:MAG: hypothetical protein WC252_08785, partial [Candidatus Cloacimonadaceae bacterium]